MSRPPFDLEFCPIPDERPDSFRARDDLNCLGEPERAVLAGMKNPKRRREYLAGRLAAKRLIHRHLAQIIGKDCAIALSDIQILRQDSGRPCVRLPAGLPEPGPFALSISHTRSWAVAALAVSRRAPHFGVSPARQRPDDAPHIGVDIETVLARDPAWIGMAFHPSEIESEMESEPPRDALELHRLWTVRWTIKEAVLKLLGIGLSADLWDVRITQASGRLELRGRALRAWEALGSPAIQLDARDFAAGNGSPDRPIPAWARPTEAASPVGHVLSVAFTI